MVFLLPEKPRIPIFNPKFPGAESLIILLPFAQRFKGMETLPNMKGGDEFEYREAFRKTADFEWGIDPKLGTSLSNDRFIDDGKITLGRTDKIVDGELSDHTAVLYIRKLSNFAGPLGIYGNTKDTTAKAEYFGLQCPYQGNIAKWSWCWGGTVEGTTRLNVTMSSRDTNAHFIIVTIGPRGMEFWMDGLLAASNASTPTLTTSTSDAYINLSHIEPQVIGKVSDKAVHGFFMNFNRQLDKSEIQNIFRDPWGIIRPREIYVDRTLVPVKYISPKIQMDLTIAEAEFSAPSVSLSDSATLNLSIAEIDMQAENLELDDAAILTLDVANIDLQANLVELDDAVTLTLTKADANFQANNLTLDDAATLLLDIAQVDFSAPSLAISASDILTLNKADIDLSAIAPNLQISDTLILTISQADFAALSPSLQIEDTITLDVATVNLDAKLLAITASDTLSLTKADLTLTALVLSIVEPTTVCPGLVGVINTLVNKFGINIIFNVRPTPTYDPTTGDVTEIAPGPLTKRVTPFEPYGRKFIKSSLIKRGDIKTYLPACGLTFTPAPGLEVVAAGNVWKIIKVYF
jgi:hypothetical protein